MNWCFKKGFQSGFSLTELSAAIAIIAVIAGSAISVAITSDEAAKISQTRTKLDAIEDALGAYLAINKRLPCPSAPEWAAVPANFAVESASGDPVVCGGTGGFDIAGANGTIRYGTLPVLSLQLPTEYYKDGWGRPFTYVLDSRFANSVARNTTPCDGSGSASSDENKCFLYATAGDITVNDASGSARTTSAVLFVFSHGPNGHGAYFANGIAGRFNAVGGTARALSAAELENSHLTSAGTNDTFDAEFVQKAFIKEEALAGEVFDDIGRFMTKSQLVKKAGATLYQEECVVAKTILDSPSANDCTAEPNAPVCETFAQKIDMLCLQ